MRCLTRKLFSLSFSLLFFINLFYSQELDSSLGLSQMESPSQNSLHESLTLDLVIELALAHNKDIQIQHQALVVAQGKLMEQKGNLDFILGTEGSYSLAQSPQDKESPSYSGVTHITSHEAGGGIFVQKLFGFGLNTKLSYMVQHSKGKNHYDETIGNFPVFEEKGQNTGKIALELNLPLLKSFNDSITNLEIEAARSYYLQIGFQLEDKIGQTIVSATRNYLEYALAQENLAQLEMMGKKLEQRHINMEKLVATGKRSRNDLLAVEISILENQRSFELAKIQLDAARLKVLQSTGVSDSQLQGSPKLPQNPNNLEGQVLASVAVETILNGDGTIQQELLHDISLKNNNILSLQEALSQTEKKLSANKIASRPDLNLKFSLGVTGATYSNNFGKVVGAPFLNVKGVDVSGQLSLQAHLGGNFRKGIIQQAQGQYEVARLSLEQAMVDLESQLKQVCTALLIYEENLQRASKVLELQQQLYENEQIRFNAGLITINDVQDQDTQYLQAQRLYNEALVQFMNAIVEMKYYTTDLVSLVKKY